MIRERSNGRLDIRSFCGGELIPTSEIFDAMATGVIEMGSTCAGYMTGFFPAGHVMNGLPGAIKSRAEGYDLVYNPEWNLWGRATDAIEELNVHILSATNMSNQMDLMLTERIERLDDLDGMKLRSYGINSKFIATTGAAMVYLPAQEIYTAIAMGTIDGATWTTPSANYMMKLHEVTKYYLPSMRAFCPCFSGVNLDLWNELPDDLKLMLEYYYFQATTFATQQEMQDDAIAKQIMIDDWGIEFLELPQEDLDRWNEMGYELWDEIASESPLAKEWVELVKDWMRAQGRMD
ncbi:TRAP transporter substrate-binding protein DctP [Chloroflexota bacterium]